VLLGFPANADAEISTQVQSMIVVFILYPIRIWQPIGRMSAKNRAQQVGLGVQFPFRNIECKANVARRQIRKMV
jgi:hypothetical protein